MSVKSSQSSLFSGSPIMSSEERRAATVDAYVELSAEQNPSDITTAAIANKMGVTQGALFRHFASKEAVLQAVMSWVSERLLSRIDKAAQSAANPLASLEAVFHAHVAFTIEHPGVPRLMFAEMQKAQDSLPKRMARTVLQAYRERLAHLLHQAIEQKEVRADLDVDATVILFVGAIQGLVMQALLTDQIANLREQAVRVYTVFQTGLLENTSL